jgi:hypothetical protein
MSLDGQLFTISLSEQIDFIVTELKTFFVVIVGMGGFPRQTYGPPKGKSIDFWLYC